MIPKHNYTRPATPGCGSPRTFIQRRTDDVHDARVIYQTWRDHCVDLQVVDARELDLALVQLLVRGGHRPATPLRSSSSLKARLLAFWGWCAVKWHRGSTRDAVAASYSAPHLREWQWAAHAARWCAASQGASGASLKDSWGPRRRVGSRRAARTAVEIKREMN